MKNIVSIIIPCFNAEKFILKALNSVYNQTYENLECIIINDGSIDDSKYLIEEFIENKKNFKLINQKNQGLSVSRNNGIKNAKGDYLYFLDADDYLPLDAIENLLGLAIFDVDIIIGQTQITNINNNNRVGILAHNIENNTIFENKNCIFLKTVIEEGLSCIAMNKLYNHNFIKKHNLLFKENLLHEDELWFFETIFYAKKIIGSDKTTYFYHINNSESITNNRTNKNVFDVIKILDIIFYDYYLKCNEKKTKEIIGCYVNYFKHTVILSLNLLDNNSIRLIHKQVFKHVNKLHVKRTKLMLKNDIELFYFHLFLMSFLGNKLYMFYLNFREDTDKYNRKKIKLYLKVSKFLNFFNFKQNYSICSLKSKTLTK